MHNKVYICSTNMSGKSFLLQLLDNHPKIVNIPFHKFSISHLIDKLFVDIALNKGVNRR